METTRILIKHGRVIDPSERTDSVTDVLLADGKVRQLGKVRVKSDVVIDAEGMIVSPGLIDMHVHFREPGEEEAENIASGCAAAVAGGFTSVACMPNTTPPRDNEAAVEFVYRQAARTGLCNVYPIGAITKGRAGKELAEMGQMVRAGAVAFSDDGDCVADNAVMLRAMQYVTMFDRCIIQHCEDAALAGSGVMNGGITAARLGLPGIPAIAEELAVQRDVVLARSSKCRYHVAHVSTAGAVRLVREAKREGLSVTAEVCPHHLLLTEGACADYDANHKVNPPLRRQEDVEACLEGVADGTIDCLVSDHAPHGAEAKELEFLYAPFGMIGLESSLGTFALALIASGLLTWPELIERMTVRPARVLGLDKGTLREGADADVTIIDPNRNWTIDPANFASRSRNCPFAGRDVPAKAVMTIVDGQIKYRDPTCGL
jgi:dihydroorotase